MSTFDDAMLTIDVATGNRLLQNSSSCPLGFICSSSGSQASCNQIQAKAIQQFRFGDVYGGIWCPEGATTIKNCPSGSYCPDSETVLPCPEGFFCPYKTRTPQIECSQCDEGSTRIKRQVYGFFMVGALCAALLAIALFLLFRKQVRKITEKRTALEDRRVTEERERKIKQKRREQLERIRPKLESIAKHVGSLEDEKAILSTDSDGGLIFDAEALFNATDVDGSGDLSYKEMNEILNLTPKQLKEFVHFMNRLGGVPAGVRSVNKNVFVDHFIETLEQAENFDPTKKDAEILYMDIVKNQGGTKNGHIDLNNLYNTHLASFMTDTQINRMIKKFKAATLDPEAPRSGKETRRSLISMGSVVEQAIQANPQGLKGAQANSRIGKDQFIELYPSVLQDVTEGCDMLDDSLMMTDEIQGVDITFEDLSLHVTLGGKPTPVVDRVTGRIQQKTMTALMGGSGAGKTSLLNALCGRAFYGEVSGTIKVNGHETKIEDHKDAVGFVPQDDVVHAELTVRENLIFTGKFQLPIGTTAAEINDLADQTMADLGLTRVANTVVGDVTRRGVSGGEKKRVNIGLELMARPKILFLDEPTSGLDASSAMLVMTSLNGLVERQGVTICSVIHQPRKFIFDLFDSLILLGVGGKMVYHGPVHDAENYFKRLKYDLPPGESVSDWLIDISSGRLKPRKRDVEVRMSHVLSMSSFLGKSTKDGLTNRDQGVTDGKVKSEFEDASLARAELYRHWNTYFEGLQGESKATYGPPNPYPLPESIKKPHFMRQLWIHMCRNLLITQRNLESKLIDTFVIIGAIILMSALDGTVDLTTDRQPDIRNEFDVLTSSDPTVLATALPEIFLYATANREPVEYSLKVGVISGVLIGLAAARVLTDKRLEIFREAGSGYNLNAFFLSVNITSSLEHGSQILLAGGVALWLRNSAASGGAYILNFVMLAWICVSWALFFPIVVPPKNVVLVVSFFMAFFGLLFSGGLSPVLYADIYNSTGLQVFSGLFSPTRYFIETMTVSEQRTLPAQSGFTVIDDLDSENFPMALASFNLTKMALNDFPQVTVQSFDGWYWGVFPAFMVGLTVRIAAGASFHIFNRSLQSKKSLYYEFVTKTPSFRLKMSAIGTIFVFLASVALTIYAILS